MNLPLLKLAEPQFPSDCAKADMLFSVARVVADTLARSDGITRQFLTQQMTEGSRPSTWCNFGCGRGPSSGGFGGDV
jgi:hypothetical protein